MTARSHPWAEKVPEELVNTDGRGEALAEELLRGSRCQKCDENCDAHTDQMQLLLAQQPADFHGRSKSAGDPHPCRSFSKVSAQV